MLHPTYVFAIFCNLLSVEFIVQKCAILLLLFFIDIPTLTSFDCGRSHSGSTLATPISA